jgi:hypothetical protein
VTVLSVKEGDIPSSDVFADLNHLAECLGLSSDVIDGDVFDVDALADLLGALSEVLDELRSAAPTTDEKKPWELGPWQSGSGIHNGGGGAYRQGYTSGGSSGSSTSPQWSAYSYSGTVNSGGGYGWEQVRGNHTHHHGSGDSSVPE